MSANICREPLSWSLISWNTFDGHWYGRASWMPLSVRPSLNKAMAIQPVLNSFGHVSVLRIIREKTKKACI